MSEFIKSTRLFLWGILRHGYVLLPGIAGGGVDVYERVSGNVVNLPDWLGWSILGFCIAVAATWSYHDQRMATAEDGVDRRRTSLKDLLGDSVAVGAEVVASGPAPLVDGWKEHTEALVCAALGRGEAVRVFSREIGPKWSPVTILRQSSAEPAKLPPPYGGTQVNAMRDLIGRVDELPIYDGFEVDKWRVFDRQGYEEAHMRPVGHEESAVGKPRDICPWCEHGLPYMGQTECKNCGATIWGESVWKVLAGSR